MPTLTPQTAGDWGTFIASILAVMGTVLGFPAWLFKTFVTKRSAESQYVKIVNPDGTRNYIHPDDWKRMDDKMEELLSLAKQRRKED